jgi:uncharacterized protein (TIGR02757 family)
MNLSLQESGAFLELKYLQYNNPGFIDTDPVSIPHRYSRKEDIEIAGFFSATLAWGNRKSILKNALRLMQLMDDAPYDFVSGASRREIARLAPFTHRTFNGGDAVFFILALKRIYLDHGGAESLLAHAGNLPVKERIRNFRKIFLSDDPGNHAAKHVADPGKGSAAKRINLFLRWMVRRDNHGVDFGLWRDLSPSRLICPLDVHTGNVARKLGLLDRKQNDWQAAEDLTTALRRFDPEDPVRFDFALFGTGVFEKF